MSDGQVGEHLGQPLGEGRVEDDRRGAGVVEQVAQLLGDVAVVHVERRDPGLVGAEHRLDVLVAVVEVAGEVVLPALVPAERAPLGVGAEPGADQVVGQPVGALGHLAVGEPSVAPHDALAVGDGGADRVVHVSEVELHATGSPHGLGGRCPRTVRGMAGTGSNRRQQRVARRRGRPGRRGSGWRASAAQSESPSATWPSSSTVSSTPRSSCSATSTAASYGVAASPVLPITRIGGDAGGVDGVRLVGGRPARTRTAGARWRGSRPKRGELRAKRSRRPPASRRTRRDGRRRGR